MEHPESLALKQITSKLLNQENVSSKSNLMAKPKQPLKPIANNIRFPWKSLLHIDTEQLNFGQCIPGTIHERIISLTLRSDLSQPVSFALEVVSHDQKLRKLPEYVFVVKKDKQFEYTDFYRFKLSKKGKYDFVINVKTPNFPDYLVQSQLRIYCQHSDLTNPNQFYTVKLQQQVCMPIVECNRQLIMQNPLKKAVQPLRVLKFSQIKTKIKKQVKIYFNLSTDTKLTLLCDLIGAQPQKQEFQKNLIQLKSNQIQLPGKCGFIVTFKFDFPESMLHYLQALKNKNKKQIASYTLRRILIMKVSQTDIYFHYPVEVKFYLGSKKDHQNGSSFLQ